MPSDVVRLSLPAVAAYAAIARHAAADLAGSAGFDADEVDDLGRELDERARDLFDRGSGHVDLQFTLAPGTLALELGLRGGSTTRLERHHQPASG